ncbi:hypothetical protein H2200_009205 [Cladophialophora chaetospira]|uniref:Glycosyl transferase n=1 Tax=Cladophialophora chaetospira TaxID=386627 RepID=A0AA38X3M9_9EURO|nr:hypothetical protein H2200_009205 [Cladophialophora chaetospira]
MDYKPAGTMALTMTNPRLGKIVVAMVALAATLLLLKPPVPTSYMDRLTSLASQYRSEGLEESEKPEGHAVVHSSIPNQVHYVFLLKSPNATFHFNFANYISMYSVCHYWNPDRIYLHTDASEEAICQAQGRCGDGTGLNKWTHLIFQLPKLHIVPVTAPTYANISKVEINDIEHKADFIRVEAIHKYGGVYLDWNAFPIRDIAVLRNSGFDAVAGRDHDGCIQTGTWMAMAGSRYTQLWMEQQHIVYDGGRITHFKNLATALGRRLVKDPGGFLIMEQAAFLPGGRDVDSQIMMYKTHEDFPSPLRNIDIMTAGWSFPDDDELSGTLDRMIYPERFPNWTYDFSSTYVVHAFRTQGFTVEGYQNPSPRSILQRQSNFARALYSATMDAYMNGLFELDDAFDA